MNQKGFALISALLARLRRAELPDINVQRGFTLIELLVVIVIISILVGLTAISYSAAQARGRDGQRKPNIATIRNALEIFFNDNNRYPCESSASPCTASMFTTDQSTMTTLLGGVLPADPKDISTIYYPTLYDRPSTATYWVWACLENINDPEKDAADGATTGGPRGTGDACPTTGRVSYTKGNP